VAALVPVPVLVLVPVLDTAMVTKRNPHAVAALLALGLLAPSCKKGGGTATSGAGAPASGAAPTTDVDAETLVGAWQKAGLQIDGFGPVDGTPFAAKSCMGGKVAAIDATVCHYDDDGTLASGQAAADKTIGAALVAVPLVRGHTLLVLIDTAKSDPKGASSKVMNTMAKVFMSL